MYKPSHIPADARDVVTDYGTAWLFEMAGKLYAIGVRAKAVRNTDFHYRFRSEESRTEYVNKWLDSLAAHAESVASRRAKRSSFSHTLKVGDILRASWGYEQTNIDYYEVVAVKSKFVDVREIGQLREGGDRGECAPAPGQYIGKVEHKRVVEGNAIKFASYKYAYLIQPHQVAGCKIFPTSYWSAYA